MFIFEPQCHTLVTFFLNLPRGKDEEIFIFGGGEVYIVFWFNIFIGLHDMTVNQ